MSKAYISSISSTGTLIDFMAAIKNKISEISGFEYDATNSTDYKVSFKVADNLFLFFDGSLSLGNNTINIGYIANGTTATLKTGITYTNSAYAPATSQDRKINYAWFVNENDNYFNFTNYNSIIHTATRGVVEVTKPDSTSEIVIVVGNVVDDAVNFVRADGTRVTSIPHSLRYVAADTQSVVLCNPIIKTTASTVFGVALNMIQSSIGGELAKVITNGTEYLVAANRAGVSTGSCIVIPFPSEIVQTQ